MVPGTYNITIYKGSTFSISVTAKDDLGNALDFSSLYTSAEMQIRNPWKPDPLFILSTTNGRLEFTTDKINFLISAEDTALIDFKTGNYDLELTNSSVTPIVVDKLLRGEVTIISEQTV